MKKNTKKKIIYTIITIIAIILLLNLNLKLQKPKIIHEQSPDLNKDNNIHINNQRFITGKNNKTTVLMIHGLGASPYQTLELAQFLLTENITTHSTRVRGHGTNLKDIEKTKIKDWYQGIEEEYLALKPRTEKLCVLGVSNGANLALLLAMNYEIDCLIIVAPPIFMQNKNINLIPFVKYFKRYHYFGVDQTQVGYAYENLPTKTIDQFLKLIKQTKSNLYRVDEPILIIQSANDKQLLPKGAQYVYDNVNSETKEILILNSVGHAVIKPYEEDTFESLVEKLSTFTKIQEFLEK